MKILLTNDDSHNSPLLSFTIQKLKSLGTLAIVVPEHEQSWKAKSITRFDDLHLRELEIGGHAGYTLTGTPADCVNFGVYHLFDSKPDLVISGINVGHNTGLSFIWSSGTVGACIEGNIAGVPGVALSQMLSPEVFDLLRGGGSIDRETESRLRVQTDILLERLFDVFLSQSEFLEKPVTWNVNFPVSASADTPFRVVPVARNTYGSLFRRDKNALVHDLANEDISLDERRERDGDSIIEGFVTISELDPWTVGETDAGRMSELSAMFE